jgi:hypothetical protein
MLGMVTAEPRVSPELPPNAVQQLQFHLHKKATVAPTFKM